MKGIVGKTTNGWVALLLSLWVGLTLSAYTTSSKFELESASRAIQFKKFSNGDEMFVVAEKSATDLSYRGNIRLYNPDASIYQFYTIVEILECHLPDSLVLSDPNYLSTFSQSITKSSRYTVQKQAILMILTLLRSDSLSKKYEAGTEILGTNYIFVGAVQGSETVAIIDLSVSPISEAIKRSDSGYFKDTTECAQQFTTDFLLMVDVLNSIIVLKRVDLSSSLWYRSDGNGFSPTSVLQDNLRDNFIFTILDDGNKSLYLHYYDCAESNNGVPTDTLTPVLMGSNSASSNMANLGTHKYLGVVRASAGKFSLVSKLDLAITDLGPILQTFYKYSMAVGDQPELNKLVFGHLGVDGATSRPWFYLAQYVVPPDPVLPDYCLNRDDHNICQSCVSGYYRTDLNPGNTCIGLPNIPTGYGADSSQQLVARCLTGCLLCRFNYARCYKCDISNNYYLEISTGSCLVPANFPTGKGIDSANGLVRTCSLGSACLECFDDYSQCTKCNSNNGYYMYSGTCTIYTSLPSGIGGDPSTGLAVSCQEATCTACNQNFQLCDPCGTGISPRNYLHINGSCLTITQVPSGFTIDESLGKTVACSSPWCLECTTSALICLKCNSAAGYYLQSGGCQDASQLSLPLGIDTSTSLLLPCLQEGCKLCQRDYLGCTKCDLSNYILDSNNKCIKKSASISIRTIESEYYFQYKEPTKASEDFRLVLRPTSLTGTDNLKALLVILEAKLELKFKWKKFSTLETDEVTMNYKKEVSAHEIQYIVRIDSSLAFERYQVEVEASTSPILLSSTASEQTFAKIRNQQFEYKNAYYGQALKSAGKVSKSISNLLAPSSTNDPGRSFGVALIISLDSTGVLPRLLLILKLINRLYYISEPFGKLLTSFLRPIARASSVTQNPGSGKYVRKMDKYRSKLSQEGLPLTIFEEMAYQPWVYISSWTVSRIARIIALMKPKVSKWGLLPLHYIPKLHLVIFTMCFVDLAWVKPRVIFHSRENTGWNSILSSTLSLQLALDFWWILSVIFNCPSALMIGQLSKQAGRRRKASVEIQSSRSDAITDRMVPEKQSELEID